jgi:hypothetical protein
MGESESINQTRKAFVHLNALGGHALRVLSRIDSQAVFDFYVSAAVQHFAELPEREQHKRWVELALAEREQLLQKTMAPDLDALPPQERKAAEEQIRAMMKRYRKELEVYESKF